ncbi:hypothetical protein [Salinarimonas soli]|uniref:Uncharacterized protein n=1 Tax=Salinarimonas soli TaxID=1638099 RepID=A0A5B2VCE7_9HYPH|nr:hypothetical protein [Salinarimonas soli]KAA2236428.1 hypothetical protein F0L46_14900 [Salinarimonas soli]
MPNLEVRRYTHPKGCILVIPILMRRDERMLKWMRGSQRWGACWAGIGLWVPETCADRLSAMLPQLEDWADEIGGPLTHEGGFVFAHRPHQWVAGITPCGRMAKQWVPWIDASKEIIEQIGADAQLTWAGYEVILHAADETTLAAVQLVLPPRPRIGL